MAQAPSPVFSRVSHAPGTPTWYAVSRGNMVSIIAAGHKYIRNGDGRVELYDLDADSGETRNLAGAPDRQGLASRLRALIDSVETSREAVP